MDSPLRISSNEPPMQASKWLDIPLLIDATEMRQLFDVLGDFYIYGASSLCKPGEEQISKQEFLQKYETYIQDLKNGRLPDESTFRRFFSSIFTVSSEFLYIVQTANGQHLVRVSKPVIQLQPHRLSYSTIDGKFRSMVLGIDNLSWGIQFSYPQIFQDPQNNEVKQVADNLEFPNTALFRAIQRWIRHHTIPSPFLVEGKKINVPARLGKECLTWINQHPQFEEKGFRIV